MEQNTKETSKLLRCTLTDDQLMEACRHWIKSLCKTNGNSWTLEVPVNFNKDPDFLFAELIDRFRRTKHTPEHFDKVKYNILRATPEDLAEADFQSQRGQLLVDGLAESEQAYVTPIDREGEEMALRLKKMFCG